MDLNMLFENFDLLMDSPNGTAKMRELILQLAVQGKLVEQDPNDEPASELLKRIKAEKEKLIAEGKIKKQRPLPPITEEEITYELPQGWEWVRLGGISQHNSGKTLDKGRNKGEMREYITTSNLYWGYFILDNLRKMPIKDEELEKCTATKGDLLICEGGEAGRASVWDYEDSVCFQNHIHRVRFFCEISPYYAYRFFEKLNCTGEINSYRKGVAISSISGKTLSSIIISLPPLAEQKRIVAKVDQLMHLCDQLDAWQKKAATKYTSLNDAALEKLSSSKTIEEFAEHWQFICNNFDLIYNDPTHVNKLRQAILQLAVQGKLAPQNPTDEPASELLKRIKAEKEKLIAQGKIKKTKPLPPITEDEILYELPQGWTWVRLGELAVNIHYGFTASANNSVYDVRLMRITDIQKNKVNWNTVPGCEIHDTEIVKYALKDNDILIARTGGTIGKSFIVKKIPIKAVFASYLIRVIPWEILDADYIKLFLESPMYWTQLFEKSMGTGQPNVNASSLKQLKITLPPLSEQKCIVAKVDQLMHLCDELETQLNQSQKDSEMLMQAVLS